MPIVTQVVANPINSNTTTVNAIKKETFEEYFERRLSKFMSLQERRAFAANIKKNN